MNIFVLDEDPATAASFLCDLHIGKMLLESAQILCTVAHRLGYWNGPYRPTQASHPCTLWAGTTRANWDWLIAHARAINREWMKRFKKPHKAFVAVMWATNINPGPETFIRARMNAPDAFYMAVPAELLDPQGDRYAPPNLAVEYYRRYYALKEAQWAREERILYLAHHLIGEVPPDPKRFMRWTEPSKRPAWMPAAPTPFPSEAMAKAAGLWAEGQRIVDPTRLSEAQILDLTTIVG